MVERRKIPRPHKGTTLRRILDITHEQIRKTEATKQESTDRPCGPFHASCNCEEA